MGLFIGASILTVLELFDYAYEVSVSSIPQLCSCGTRGRATPEPHGAEMWLWQVIKHRLCRRGKCRKNHKRNNTDKGVALSMDDVKRHVSAGHSTVPSCLSPPACPLLQLGGCCGVGSHHFGQRLGKEQRGQAEMLGGMVLGLCEDLDETSDPNIPFILQNPCESIRGHPAGMTYAANILPHHPARGTFEDFTC